MTFSRDIVITGTGLITPLGLTRDQTWLAVLAGKSGFGPLTALEQQLPPGRDGGQCPPLPEDFAPNRPREVRYLRRAILDALADAGLSAETLPYPAHRCGILIGTTLHGMPQAGKFLRTDDPAHLGEFLATHTLRAAAEGLPFSGIAATTCSACSSSLGSIALAVTLLEAGDFDLIIAGGYDVVSEYAYAGFNSLRLVADGPLRPFCRDRLGMKLSEGYGIVILERGTDAARRAATPFARVAGFGESADAHHLTQPHPHGDGAARAMQQAIILAGLDPSDIGLLVAHATGTHDNDASEYAAMQRTFGEHFAHTPVVAFKSHLGHTLGGAGAVELILAGMCLREQTVPPCANISAEEIEFPDLAIATGQATKRTIRATLSTSLGFGGANTCVVLQRADDAPRIQNKLPRADKDPEIPVITGIGVLLPNAIGNVAFVQLLAQTSPSLVPTIDPDAIAELVNARRARRISDYVRYMLAAATLAMRDAGVADAPAFAAGASVILGSTHGSSSYCESYYRQIVAEGIMAANPMLFAEGVPNAASAHVSLAFGVQGGCQTIIGSRTSGLDALALAANRIRVGQCDRIIVGAAEEYAAITNRAYAHCSLHRDTSGREPLADEGGFTTSAGAVVMIVESRRAAEARGARIYGTIRATAMGFDPVHHASRALTRILQDLGSPTHVLSSANSTRIDRIERGAIERICPNAVISSLYRQVAELFSAGPLAGIAAVLLGGKLPGDKPGDSQAIGDFAVLSTDYTGVAAGARITSEPAL